MAVCGKLGMTLATRIGLLVLLSVVAAGGLAADVEKEKESPGKPQGVLHTIDARVTYSAGTSAGTNILAERLPGYFTVPAGQVARHFKYYFVDPTSSIERDKLNNRTIYCETSKSWVEIPADPRALELPPGDYKFVVGGTPGASGTLNFRTFASGGAAPPPPGGDKRPPPPIRKPPPPGDTTKTGIKPTPLHPGGEGKRKVKVYLDSTITDSRGATHSSGDLSATLTVSAGVIRLDFDTNPGETAKETDRWEGTLTRQEQVLTVKGSILKYYPPGVPGGMSSTWRGTFEGHLEGTVLKGTMAAHNGDVQADWKAEWSIKDFAK